MYKNILVPMALDHGYGKPALKVAQQLLDKDGQITALHVYEALQGSVSTYVDDDVIRNAFESTKAELEQRVEGMPNVTPVIIRGHSGRSIIDHAADIGADCIVMGSLQPGLIDYLLGSTAARVVRHAQCSVHVLRSVDLPQ